MRAVMSACSRVSGGSGIEDIPGQLYHTAACLDTLKARVLSAVNARGPPAHRTAVTLVREPARRGSRGPDRARRRAALDHRAERRRQDDVLPPDLGRDGALGRARVVQGP